MDTNDQGKLSAQSEIAMLEPAEISRLESADDFFALFDGVDFADTAPAPATGTETVHQPDAVSVVELPEMTLEDRPASGAVDSPRGMVWAWVGSLTLHLAFVLFWVIRTFLDNSPPTIELAAGNGGDNTGGIARGGDLMAVAHTPLIDETVANSMQPIFDEPIPILKVQRQTPNKALKLNAVALPAITPPEQDNFEIPLTLDRHNETAVAVPVAVSLPRRESPSPVAAAAGSRRANISGGGGGSDGPPVGSGSNPKPPYPPAELAAGIEGVVTLRVEVRADGSVRSADLSQSSGNANLDKSALNTVRNYWRFTPARAHGRSVQWEGEVPVRFQIRR